MTPPKKLKQDDEKPHIMICSQCGNIIAKIPSNAVSPEFDIFDCSWECNLCGFLWLSSDGWTEIGNLLIPTRC